MAVKLLKIERTNSLPVNLIHSLAYGSVLAYIIINGKTHLAKLTEDIDLHSGSSVELDLRPVEDSNDYELSVMKNN